MTKDLTTTVKIIFYICLGLFFFCLGGLVGDTLAKKNQEKVIEKEFEEIYIGGEELSEWTILQLAIMKTESSFDPSAIGSGNALGLYQITPICAAEANRLLGEEKYSHLDAFDIRKSIEIFNIVQGNNNSGKSISKAISIQNPGGASIGYGKKVYDNIRFIKRMEEARRELIKYEVEQRLNQE